MKKEDMDLLLKDLCGRLPYGVKCKISYNSSVINDADATLYGVDKDGFLTFDEIVGDYREFLCKPYLFPLSSMTEEQVEKLQEELCDMYDPYHDYDSYENWGVEVLKKHIHSDKYKFTFTSDVIDWLNKNHFDYRHLIEKGLAVDATGLRIYE